MPANAAIVVADSQATPVNHTFTPVRIDGDVASYLNFAETVGIGRESLALRLTENARVRKVVTTMKKPRLITETINEVSVPSAPDFAVIKVEAIVPQTWTPEEAQDIVEMSANLLKNSIVIGMVDKGEFVY